MLTPNEQKELDLAERLGEAWRASGIRQKDIAEACGVTSQAVSGWLKTGKITKQNLETFAQVTGVNFLWLLSGPSSPGADRGVVPADQVAETRGEYLVNEKSTPKLDISGGIDPRAGVQLRKISEMVRAGRCDADDLAAVIPMLERLASKKN